MIKINGFIFLLITVICFAPMCYAQKNTKESICAYRMGAGVKNDTFFPFRGVDDGLAHYSEIKVSKKCSNGIETTFNLSSTLFTKTIAYRMNTHFKNASEKNNIEVSRKYTQLNGRYHVIGIDLGYITDEDFLYGGSQNQQSVFHQVFSNNDAVSVRGSNIKNYEYKPIPYRDNEYYVGGKLAVGKIITLSNIKNCAFYPRGVCADFLQVETGTQITTQKNWSNIFILVKADKAVLNLFSDKLFLSILGSYDLKTRLEKSRAEQTVFYGLKVDAGTFQVTMGASKPIGQAQSLWNIMDDKDTLMNIMFDIAY